MSKSLIFIFLFCCVGAYAQNPVIINQPYDFQSWIKVKNTLQFPGGCGTPSGTASLNGADKTRPAIYADTCNKKLYWFSPKDSTWKEIGGVAATPTLNDVLGSGNTGINKNLFLQNNIADQSIIAVYNRDTSNDNSVARLDARAYRGKAVVTVQGGSHAFNGLQFYRYTQSPGSYLPYLDSTKTFELLQNPDTYGVPQLRNGLQLAFVDPRYEVKLMSFDTTGKTGLTNIEDPKAWLDLPAGNGAGGGTPSLRLRPGTFSANDDAGAIDNTGTFLTYRDNNHIIWNLNDQCRNAVDGSVSAPSFSFTNGSSSGMWYSPVLSSPVITGNTTGSSLGLSNTNSSGYNGIAFMNPTITGQQGFIGYNNALSRFRIAANSGFSLDFESGGFNDNNPTMRLTSGGNMLVGTTTDNSYKMQVNGGIFSDNGTSNSFTARGSFFGTPTFARFSMQPSILSGPLNIIASELKTDLSADSIAIGIGGSISDINMFATNISNNHNSTIRVSSSGLGKSSIMLQSDSLAISSQIKTTTSDTIYVAGVYDAGTKTNSIYKESISDARGYKIYTALLSQSGTSDPTVTVLGSNQIGTIVWTRNSTGNYTGTLTGAFTSNKTWLICQKGDGSGNFINGLLSRANADALTLDTRDNTGTVTDNFTNMSIEIRVYQ